MDNIEIAHRIKNSSIIVKFLDRPSRDDLFTKKVHLKGITTADVGLGVDENSIFINESLAFQTKKLLSEVKKKRREVGYHHIITDNGLIKVKKNKKSRTWVKISSKKDLDGGVNYLKVMLS